MKIYITQYENIYNTILKYIYNNIKIYITQYENIYITI